MELKKGAKVIARTVRGTEEKKGKIVSIDDTRTGKFVRIQPDDGGKEFSTRPALVRAA